MPYSLSRRKKLPSDLGNGVSDEASGYLWLIPDGGAVIARVGGAAALAGLRVNAYRVDQADVALPFHRVAARFYLSFHFRRKEFLHQHHIGQPLVVKAGSVDGRLRVHAEAHPVQNGKQGRGNDGRAAGGTRDEAELPIAKYDRGRHGAERPLAWRDGISFRLNQAKERIGYAGLRGEIVHFVVQKKTRRRGDVRTVAVVERGRAGHGISGRIHDGEVRRVRTFAEADDGIRRGAGVQSLVANVRVPGVHIVAGRGAMQINGAEQLSCVTRIGEPGDGYVGEIGISKIGRAIGKDAAHHFHNHVHALRVVPALQRDALQHVQSLNRRYTAGAWRRSGEHLPALAAGNITTVESFANLRLIMGEVVHRDQATRGRSRSPARYILPSFRKMWPLIENCWRPGRSSANSRTSFSLTGKPCSARRMAGCITSGSFMVPCVFRANARPATVPGTATER